MVFKKPFVMIGALLLIVGVVVAYEDFDLFANYQRTAATITKVDEVCYLRKRGSVFFSKASATTKERSCTIARLLNETRPEYRDFDLVKVTYVEYRYRSPVDGKTYRGNDKLINRKGKLLLRSGDEGEVYAHKARPMEAVRFRVAL